MTTQTDADDFDSICIFSVGENYGSAPSSRRRQRSSALQLVGFESFPFIKQKREAVASLFYLATADILDTVSNGFTLNETLAKCETLSAK